MPRYVLNDAEFELPLGWFDQSINIFAPTAILPASSNLIITRDPLRDGEDLYAFVERQRVHLQRKAPELTLQSATELTVDNRPAIQFEAAVCNEIGSRVIQHQVFIACKDRVLTIVFSMSADEAQEQRIIFDDLLSGLSLRGDFASAE